VSGKYLSMFLLVSSSFLDSLIEESRKREETRMS
jgi:hypothetical protein